MRRIRAKLFFMVLIILAGAFAVQNCSEESDQIVDHEFDSSCLTCHTDQEALTALAEEEHTGDEPAGEG